MRVSVTTGCRLHLGFTNLSKDVGRSFGSIGVTLDRPGTTVVLEESDELRVDGDDGQPILTAVQCFSDYFRVEPRVAISVRERIPEHVGLGSGTQLALAVGMGLAAICGIDADVSDVAVAVRRGRRSGIGIAAFRGGGFVIDAGVAMEKTGRETVPVVVWRPDFPADWCFVVAVPLPGEGLSGHGEEGVFAALTPSVHVSEEICRITQVQLMPALVERDIEAFGRAITTIDRKTGSYFEGVQGGLYSRGHTGQTIAAMLAAGALGVGQSSWGPAVYGLAHGNDVARLEAAVRDSLRERDLGGLVFIGHGRNRGARVEVVRDDS
jgi:beta-RFAP synthase